MKFKSIEIEAFRGYNKSQIFDFTVEEEIMNLIVIYAPYGFGKTSFFDAVEWGFSGNIKRIYGNNRVKEIANHDKGYILKNKNSLNRYGRVEFILENNEKIVLGTPVLNGKRQRDDDKPVIFQSSEFFKEHRNKLFINQNVLTHDKIDSFLRFSTSTERFNALKEFWDHSDDSLVYSNLIQMNKDVQKKWEDTSNKISAQRTELNAIKPNELVILNVHKLVTEVFRNDPDNMPIIMDESSDYDQAMQSLNKKLSVFETIATQSKNEIERATNLSVRLKKDYINSKSSIAENFSQKNELNKILNTFNNLNVEQQNFKQYEAKIAELNLKIRGVTYLINQYGFYEMMNSKIAGLSASKSELDRRIYNINEEMFLIEKEHINEIQEYEFLIEKRKKIKNDLSLLEDCYSKILSLEKKIFYENRIRRIEHCLIEQGKKEQQLEFIINKYKEYRAADNNTLWGKVSMEHPSDDIEVLYDQCVKLFNRNVELSNLIDEKNSLYSKYNGLNGDLLELIELGTKLVTETKNSSCPLCKHQYNDFNELLKKINNDTKYLSEIDILTNHINMLEEEKNNNTNKLIILREAYNESISTAIESLQSKYVRYIDKEKYLIGKLKNSKELFNKHQDNITLIYDFLIGYNKSNYFEETRQKLNLVSHEINLNLERMKETIGGIENSIEITKNIIISKKHELTKLKSNFEFINNQISDLLNNKEFNEYRRILLQEYELLENENFIETLTQMKDSFNALLVTETLGLNETIKNYNNFLKELEGKNYENIVNSVNQIDVLNHELNNIKNQFFTEYKLLLDVDDVSLNHLEQFISQKNETKSQNDKLIQVCKEAINNLDVLEKNELWIRKKNILNDLLAEQEYVDQLLRDTNSLVLTGKEHIQKQIETKFNLATINKIYQMIEPHPDFTNIEFRIIQQEDSQLGLMVSALNKEKTKEESPILFFSSAQVNILSLSIFLAKALESNNGYNTIFMDDPIQHLDSINLLSFIDLLRIITTELDKQVIIATHDDRFFNLVKRKLDPNFFKSKFVQLESFGRIKSEDHY
ncbi:MULTISPECIES: hypothetical protein [unclassified Paenibacillus]|uniref:hypothetical protein n=1 Tax=unclassified Paenibacillus TaxID=185978 RepID=UPI0009CDA142|nr:MULTISPECIES: hypothetical protein [unclassified Paenibacillus]SLK20050.1 DNA repair exonuclease SbcCD ATPase subunit [Paenibacillus sp. RU5A]SOC76033.1 DNA repair exonuclease SbcCD ATPase subunit [Paenibacillus sp. RU26A]SOC77764.1 DNA repair exonuclease SbcCD ATPase subunit [Paenibacillus sp. RU5M]